jgi:hypothetical protein
MTIKVKYVIKEKKEGAHALYAYTRVYIGNSVYTVYINKNCHD